MTMHATSRLQAENREIQEAAAFQAIDFIHRNAEVLWEILEASRLKSSTDAVDNLVIWKQDVVVELPEVFDDLHMTRAGLLSVPSEAAERLVMPGVFGAINWFGARIRKRIAHIGRLRAAR